MSVARIAPARRLVPLLPKSSALIASGSRTGTEVAEQVTGELVASRFKLLALGQALKTDALLVPLALRSLRALRACDAVAILRWTLKANRHNALLLEAVTQSFSCLLSRPPGGRLTIREISDFADLLRLHRHRPLGNFAEVVAREVFGRRWDGIDRFSPCDLLKLRDFFLFVDSTDSAIFAKLDARIANRLGHFGASEIAKLVTPSGGIQTAVSPDKLAAHFCRTEIPKVGILHMLLLSLTRSVHDLSATSRVELRQVVDRCAAAATQPKDLVKVAECYGFLGFFSPSFISQLSQLQPQLAQFHSSDAARLLRSLAKFDHVSARACAAALASLFLHTPHFRDPVFVSLALRALLAGQSSGRGLQELLVVATERLLRFLHSPPVSSSRTAAIALGPHKSSLLATRLARTRPGDFAKTQTTTRLPERVSASATQRRLLARTAKSRRRLSSRRLRQIFEPDAIADEHLREFLGDPAVLPTPTPTKRPAFRSGEPRMAKGVETATAAGGKLRDAALANTVTWRRWRRGRLSAFEQLHSAAASFEYVIPKRPRRDAQLSFEDAVNTLAALDVALPRYDELATALLTFALDNGGELTEGQLHFLLRRLQKIRGAFGSESLGERLAELVCERCESFRLDALRSLRTCFPQLAKRNTALAAKLVLSATRRLDGADVIAAAPTVAYFAELAGWPEHPEIRTFFRVTEDAIRSPLILLNSEAEVEAARDACDAARAHLDLSK